MPWTGKGFKKKHNKKLSGSEASHAARIANAILKQSGDEGMAIATANKIVGRKDHDPMKHGYTKEDD
jgi:uncharacterized protein YdaT